MSSRFKDWNRKRAIHSYCFINEMSKEIGEGNEDERAKLLSICRKLPMQIKENGIIRVLAYYSNVSNEEGKEKIEKRVGMTLEKWIKEELLSQEDEEVKEVIKDLATYSFSKYCFINKEVMEYAIWLKRNAEGML